MMHGEEGGARNRNRYWDEGFGQVETSFLPAPDSVREAA